MIKVTVLAGMTALALMAGCAKQEAPQAQVDDGATTAAQPAPAPVQPEAKDRSKAAADMAAYLDPSPQCQQYRDELIAKGNTPGSVDELSEIFVRASTAGCGGGKKQQ